MAEIFIEESTLTSIGDAIRSKEGSTELVPVNDMATRITNLPSGGADSGIVLSGNCNYAFYYGTWDKFADRVSTENISSALYMFNKSKLSIIPFELNFDNSSTIDISSIFNTSSISEVPKMNNCKPKSISSLFSACYYLRNLPADFIDWFDWSYLNTATSGFTQTFMNCYSLRSFPMSLFNRGALNMSYSSAFFASSSFMSCYSLDELVELPLRCSNTTWTSNAFSSSFNNCNRLKNLTFPAYSDAVPYLTMKWKKQTIDLSLNVGYIPSGNSDRVLNYNSGITADKEVKDDATYQALKNDPDWFTQDIAYSRYNHDSAVATINSLPDTSAYLATTSGTNTIKFKGEAGSATDGGAINTLTEEEIAVATAKGWTVTLV